MVRREMMRQRHVGLMAGVCFLVYLAAVGSEAAYSPGGIGFAEELTWARMSAAYRVTVGLTFAPSM